LTRRHEAAAKANRMMRLSVILLASVLSFACGGPAGPSERSAYQGQWTGSYRVDRCTWSPAVDAYARFCNGYDANSTFSLSITFSQNHDVVTGQFVAGDLVSDAFVSALDAQGGIQIRASNTTFPYAYDFMWQLSAPVRNRLQGTVLLTRTGNAGLVGSASIEGSIVTLTR
jgi:hypothetical protein